MKIRLIGQANHTGIGTHFSGFCRALRSVRPDLAVDILDGFDDWACQRAVLESRPTDINICFIGTNMRRLQGRNIQWIPFESTKVPDMLTQTLLDCHEIWSMTQWGRQLLINNGMPPGKIAVVGQGIDANLWRQTQRSSAKTTRDYLLVGKYEQRKGIVETVEAWAQTLGGDNTARLTIKTHAATQAGDAGYHELMAQIQTLGIENYRIIWGLLEDHDMVKLYQESDAFVLPTRAEGWGRPLMEAAAMGLPIMTTRYSAHGEWLEHIKDSVIWIDHDMVDLDDPDFRRAYGQQDDWGQWARPRLPSVIDALLNMHRDFDGYRARAAANANWIRQHYCWTAVARRALDTLQMS